MCKELCEDLLRNKERQLDGWLSLLESELKIYELTAKHFEEIRNRGFYHEDLKRWEMYFMEFHRKYIGLLNGMAEYTRDDINEIRELL